MKRAEVKLYSENTRTNWTLAGFDQPEITQFRNVSRENHVSQVFPHFFSPDTGENSTKLEGCCETEGWGMGIELCKIF